MNTKQSEWGDEIGKPAVCANCAKTCTGMQTKPVCSSTYSVFYTNLRKFGGIFRYGDDVALMEAAHEHEAKRVGS